jgi:hypothetical protein
MMMKLSVDELEVGKKYWLDNVEDVWGYLVDISENTITFWVDPQHQKDYVFLENKATFFRNDYLYKPLN